ncbi:MAG: thioredoxin fold domain-containing protein [Alphaproteobacteria bacterium]|nr:thioredoxin fold domain-containing protein [Alphaproteobacteria bacterium]
MRRLIFFFLPLCAVIALLSLPSAAQLPQGDSSLFSRDARPLDINSVPVLSNLVKNGAKLYFLGERSGLQGWFIIKDGQVQMIYVTPDKKTAIIGGMFSGEGDNVTGPQIKELASINKEVGDLVNGAGRQQEDVTKAGATPGGFAAIPGGTQTEAGNLLGNKLPAVSLSPGERLLQDLKAAAGVTLGKNENAEMLIVIDPHCPHCKATWRELRKPVQEGLVEVRLLPITNNPAGDDTRAAAQLLKAANPFEAWDKYVSGDKSALAGEADNLHKQAVLSNNLLIEKWNIRSTPYIVYRAKDGRVKIVQGAPERMASVLSDLLK